MKRNVEEETKFNCVKLQNEEKNVQQELTKKSGKKVFMRVTKKEKKKKIILK